MTLASGQTVQNMICYEGISDWYRITVPDGNDLLDISAGYPGGVATPVTLDVKVFALSSGSTGSLLNELTAPSTSDAGLSAIRTTIRVPGAGDYFLQVADAHGSGVNVDTTNAYSLQVSTAADPDSHEPNDSPAAAKPTDSAPGYLAYLDDLDVFTISVADATDLLTLNLTNPAGAPAPIQFQVSSSAGAIVAEGSASPSAKPMSTVFPVQSAGSYYLTLSYAPGVTPDRTASDGYTVSFGTASNPDANDNHTIASALCPGGGTGPCTAAYVGSAVSLPTQTGYIAVPGQRDYYRIDVTSGAPLVVQIDVESSSTTVQYAVDLLTADANSPCTTDSDCAAINQACTKDTDCELSHSCLPAGQYTFCPTSGVSCTLCAGASTCIMNGTSGVCAVSQFLSAYSPGQKPTGSSTVSTAQPLFTVGTYYIIVHDAQNANYDEAYPYTLKLAMVPEPDPYDQATNASGRNNFYNPYPTADTDRTPNKARAVALTNAQLSAGISGFISYQTDEDWFSFASPCQSDAGDTTCGLNFQWTQPASNVKVAFFVLDPDSLLPRESFAYTGTVPPSGPVVSSFDNSDCMSCSFGTAGQTYYMQITDIHEKAWDYSSSGQYAFNLTGVTAGCPSVCTNSGGTCLSQCVASNTCCPTLQ
jgi:hypothetical protein